MKPCFYLFWRLASFRATLARHASFFSDGDDGDKQALPGLYRPSPRCSPFARHDETTDRRTCWVVGAWKAGGRGCGGGLKGGSKSLRNCEMQSCLRRIFFFPLDRTFSTCGESASFFVFWRRRGETALCLKFPHKTRQRLVFHRPVLVDYSA